MSKAYFVNKKDPDFVIETDDASRWSGDQSYRRISVAEGRRTMKEYADRQLRKVIKSGDTIWTNTKHVSRSGMSRDIQVFVISENEPVNVSMYAARVLEWPVNRDTMAVKVGGYGMDMGFHLVYSLACCLFSDGDGKPNGYALKQRWL